MDDFPQLSDVFRTEAIEARKHPHVGLASILHTSGPAVIAGWWVLLASFVVCLLFFSRVPMVESFEAVATSPDLATASTYLYEVDVAASKSSRRIKLPADLLSTCTVPYLCIRRTRVIAISTRAPLGADSTMRFTVVLSEPVQPSRVVALVVLNGEVSLANLIQRRINSIGRAN